MFCLNFSTELFYLPCVSVFHFYSWTKLTQLSSAAATTTTASSPSTGTRRGTSGTPRSWSGDVGEVHALSWRTATATPSLPWLEVLIQMARVWRSGVQSKERLNWQVKCFQQKPWKALDSITHSWCQSTKDLSCYCMEASKEVSKVRSGSSPRRTQSGPSLARCWWRGKSTSCCRWTTSSART